MHKRPSFGRVTADRDWNFARTKDVEHVELPGGKWEDIASPLERRHVPSKAIARVGSITCPLKCQRYGGKIHDQPSTSPASIVSIVIGPYCAAKISSATLPSRMR